MTMKSEKDLMGKSLRQHALSAVGFVSSYKQKYILYLLYDHFILIKQKITIIIMVTEEDKNPIQFCIGATIFQVSITCFFTIYSERWNDVCTHSTFIDRNDEH